MCEPGEGASTPGTPRPAFALGRALPGRLLNPPPPGRLTSLRSRDLTLGGYKKKTFIPNVHSIRKSKDELKEETRTAPKKERREREDRQRERRRRERPQTIQSHSIFEQGPADSFRKIGWGSTNLSDCDSALVTKSIKKEKNVPEDDDSEILQKLQRDDFLDDPGLKNDPKQRPIRLPLYQSCNLLTTETTSSVKDETPACFASPTTHRGIPLQASRTCQGHQPPTVGDLFQQLSVSDKEELFFIQLPDTVPVPLKTASCEKPAKKDGKAEDRRVKPQDSSENEAAPVLSDISEGPIGKLQIRKSGRAQLLMGDIALDVSEGAAFSFLQVSPRTATLMRMIRPAVQSRSSPTHHNSWCETVTSVMLKESVYTDMHLKIVHVDGMTAGVELIKTVLEDVQESMHLTVLLCALPQQLVCVRLTEGLSGDMTVLGNVKHKLVCSPDFEALLQGVKGPSNTHAVNQS